MSCPGPDWRVKIADFGIAKDTAVAGTTIGLQGTLGYIAPEAIFEATGRYTPAVDIWALAAVAFCLLTRRPPFEGIHEMVRFSDGVTQFPTKPLGKVTYNCVQFILGTMKASREDRLTTTLVIGHSWLAKDDNSKYSNPAS